MTGMTAGPLSDKHGILLPRQADACPQPASWRAFRGCKFPTCRINKMKSCCHREPQGDKMKSCRHGGKREDLEPQCGHPCPAVGWCCAWHRAMQSSLRALPSQNDEGGLPGHRSEQSGRLGERGSPSSLTISTSRPASAGVRGVRPVPCRMCTASCRCEIGGPFVAAHFLAC